MTETARQDEKEIRELIAEQVDAMRAGDVERLVARFTPDVVQYSLAPGLRHVGPEVRDPDRLRAWFATFDGPVDYEVRDLEISVGGDVAFCHSLNRMSATPKGTATPNGTDFRFDLWHRATVCLRRTGGRWLVAHEHQSTPFYMDGSFKAAVDLLP
jgi:uncharacterized protein (TIGR02246 family)